MQALDQLRDETRQFLVRTQSMLIGSILIALIVFLLEFGPILTNILQAGSGLSENYAGQVTSQYIYGFLRELSSYSYSKVAIVLIIWGVVGILAYIAVVGFLRSLISVRNEIVLDTQYAAKGSAARLLILHFGQKLLAILAFIGFGAFCVFMLIPYSMDLMRIFVYDMSWLNSMLLLIGLLGLTATIYALWSFAYLTWIYEETV